MRLKQPCFAATDEKAAWKPLVDDLDVHVVMLVVAGLVRLLV